MEDGVRDRARTKITPDGEADLCLQAETTFGLGFMVHGPFTLYSGPGSYGHPGAGGSVAFADPDRDLAFAYVMNTMATNLAVFAAAASTVPDGPAESISGEVGGHRVHDVGERRGRGRVGEGRQSRRRRDGRSYRGRSTA